MSLCLRLLSFNSLFEMQAVMTPFALAALTDAIFQYLYLRCWGVLVFCLCGFLSVSVVVLGVCCGGFCVGFVGVVCMWRRGGLW